MATNPDPVTPEIENPEPVPPVIAPADDPVPDLHDDPPPETVNLAQEDEAEQAQSIADALLYPTGGGLSDSAKVGSGDSQDDVKDLVDHMNDMVSSGRIDMDAYRGERTDDDEEQALGPAGARD